MVVEQVKAKTIQFPVNGTPIDNVTHFKYLGRWLTQSDDNLMAIRENIKKARARWARVAGVLSREGADKHTMGYFYKAVVQAVLLFGSETWVLDKRMRLMLRSFHHRCARFVAREFIMQDENGKWKYPKMEKVLEDCGLFPIDKYIARRKQTLQAYAE